MPVKLVTEVEVIVENYSDSQLFQEELEEAIEHFFTGTFRIKEKEVGNLDVKEEL